MLSIHVLYILILSTYQPFKRTTEFRVHCVVRVSFRLERIAKCSYFSLSTQNIKFYWFVMKIKNFFSCQFWHNRGSFPLGNKYFGVFVLNGLSNLSVWHARLALAICILKLLLMFWSFIIFLFFMHRNYAIIIKQIYKRRNLQNATTTLSVK